MRARFVLPGERPPRGDRVRQPRRRGAPADAHACRLAQRAADAGLAGVGVVAGGGNVLRHRRPGAARPRDDQARSSSADGDDALPAGAGRSRRCGRRRSRGLERPCADAPSRRFRGGCGCSGSARRLGSGTRRHRRSLHSLRAAPRGRGGHRPLLESARRRPHPCPGDRDLRAHVPRRPRDALAAAGSRAGSVSRRSRPAWPACSCRWQSARRNGGTSCRGGSCSSMSGWRVSSGRGWSGSPGRSADLPVRW